MLFLFCLFLCCFITRLTCKCEARCCYKPESHFSTILFANNLARSSSVIQLGCFVAWPDGKGTGHYLSTLFSVSVCVQTQSVRWDGAFRNKAYSSWQHGSCNWRHGGRRNLPKGLFLTGGGAFCSDVLGTWPRSGQFQFFFFSCQSFRDLHLVGSCCRTSLFVWLCCVRSWHWNSIRGCGNSFPLWASA